MPKMLRHEPTGDLYPVNEHLQRRDDMVLVNTDETVPEAPKSVTRKPAPKPAPEPETDPDDDFDLDI